MRLLKVIALTAIGLALLTASAGCAHRAADPVPPEPVVVIHEVKDTPPVDLLQCPTPPLGLPASGSAIIPADWRAAIIRLSSAYGSVSDQLQRLIQWHTGERCGALPDPAQP